MRFMLNEILKPISHRAGTAVGTFLTANQVQAVDADLIVAAVPVALGVVFDLVLRRFL